MSQAEARTAFHKARPVEVNVTVGEAFRSFSFWVLVVAAGIRNASYHAISTHFVPLMVWKGLSQPEAAFLLGVSALMGFVSTLFLGWLADRTNKPRLLALILYAGAAAMLLPIFGDSVWVLWLFTLFFTAVEATYPVGWAVVGDFFGRTHYAKIRGYMSFFYTWGSVVGPVLAGAIYDRWTTYEPLLWTLAALFALSAIFFGTLAKHYHLPPP
jgi:MFS family permease